MSGPVDGESRARQIIQEIVRKHGFVQESTLQLIDSLVSQEARREVEEALLAKDLQIGSSVLTLARNLYTSQARFVFELLQNADDNQYTRGQDPFVQFRVYPNRIEIECNEDGFTEQNLTAICDIGKSSKTGSQGYIGEKGIGFKSVFMAAWRVHIQSNDYSFDFVHRRGDSGMGMITPIWQERRDRTLPFELTRITMYLHDHDDPAESERYQQIINQQFLELQDTLLLFLRRLRKIEISFFDGNGNPTNNTIFSLKRPQSPDTATIERSCTDESQNREQTYHITKHIARGLARSENRDISEAEEATNSFSTSEIVIAFPVIRNSETGAEVPMIEPQEVFAFLPVRKMGFNFLIQADFVTQANRQDIVMTSRRNQGLINAIGDTFIQGVLQLCKYNTLEYQWMRYLPVEGSFPWDGLWKDLVSSIKYKLGVLPVFRSLEQGTCRTIKELFSRLALFNDQHGAPLFADLRPELYLSDSYAASDIRILESFGLQTLYFDAVVSMVEQDLQAEPGHSRIKSPDTNDTWNTRAYELLSIPWKNNWQEGTIIPRLKQVNIIPLQDGSWVSSEAGDIFYPQFGVASVPKDLGMKLVDQKASRNMMRRKFFDNLGVRRIDAPFARNIRQQILHHSTEGLTMVSLQSSVERMRFLFLTQHLIPEDEEENISDKFKVYSHLSMAMYPNAADFYIANDDPYGAEVFLRQKGRYANFVNSCYFEEALSVAPLSIPTLHQWMHQHLGIREHLRLVSPNKASLSMECLDTAITRSEEFLGFLGHLWPFEEHIILSHAPLLTALRETRVLCMDGEMMSFNNTYIPLRRLQDKHTSYFLGDEYFPFIQSDELSGQERVPDPWLFLVRNLGVGYKDTVGFRLQLITYLKKANEDADALVNPARVMKLYHSIVNCIERYRLPPTSDTSRMIQSFFHQNSLVFVPRWMSKPALWRKPEDCLWDAPSDFISKAPLKESYTSLLNESRIEFQKMEKFFCTTLVIRDIDWFDVVDELGALKHRQIMTRGVGTQLFEILSRRLPTEEDDKRAIRGFFEDDALIYIDHSGTPGWHRPSDCVWSDTTHIHGKIAVNTQYGHLQNLFMEILGVQQLSLAMVIDNLLAVRSLDLGVSEVKELLKSLNSFLSTEANPTCPDGLLNIPIFPIRQPTTGTVILCDTLTQFVLVDREGPPSQFKNVVKFLDFTLQEIRRLQPLLSWMGLESRYLSRCMKEVSRVGNGVQVPISQTHRDIRRKAYALLRISAACNSPRYTTNALGLYDVLRSAITIECGLISSRLYFEQDSTMHEIEISRGDLHIDDSSTLTIYVPNDAESQECCFKFDLPHRLALWMMTNPSTGTQVMIERGMINVINSILNCSIPTIGRILEKEGIPQIPGIVEIPIAALELDQSAESATEAVADDLIDLGERLPRTPNNSQGNVRFSLPNATFSQPRTPWSRGTLQSTPGQHTPLTDPRDYDRLDDPGVTFNVDSIPPPQFHLPEQQAISQYRRLLEGVLGLAERTSIPSNFEGISTAFQSLAVEDDPFEGFYWTYISQDWEHRKRVGAAGELFVFKMLSRIPSLGFNLENWRSSIRGYVQVLPEYQDLTAWPGRETSDLVYDDINGAFTLLMISLGYLTGEHWAGKTPRYYIEVKCTTGACETPCIVSQNQVDLMDATTNGPHGNESQGAVYALFRVFGLGSSSMGLKIYIDPSEQKRLGKLAFTSEKYFVAPTRR